MEKDKKTEIMELTFGNRALKVEYDFYEGRRICHLCGNNAIVFKIVEVKEAETGFYVRDINLKKRYQLRRAIINSLDVAEPCIKHCKECGAEIEVVVPPYFTDEWFENSAEVDAEFAEKLDLAEASLNLSSPDPDRFS